MELRTTKTHRLGTLHSGDEINGKLFSSIDIAAIISRDRISLAAKTSGEGRHRLPLSNAFSYYKRELERIPSGCVVESRGA